MASVNKNFKIEKGLDVGDQALTVDGTTDRTGVGKTNPSYNLDVAGTANFDGIVAAGQIGIGTTQPVRDAEFRGDIGVYQKLYDFNDESGTNNQALISVDGPAGAGVSWTTLADIEVNAAGSTFQVQYRKENGKFGGAEHLYANDETNRIGIGISTPEYLFQIQRPTGHHSDNGYVQIGGTFLDNNASVGAAGSVLGVNDDGELRWVGAASSEFNIIFVCEDGDDVNSGYNITEAKRTVGSAATICRAGMTIRVTTGVYPENNPIDLPRNVSVDGDDLRNTQIVPLNAGKDMFHVDNGCLVQNLSFIGAANTGAMVAFTPGRPNEHTGASIKADAVVVDNWGGTTITPTSASYDQATGIMTVTAAGHGLAGPAGKNISTAVYNADVGIITVTSAAHEFDTNTQVLFAPGSLHFKCEMDNYATEHSYPRITDPYYKILRDVNILDSDTFEVQLGTSPRVLFDITDAVYNATSGAMKLTIGEHSLKVGENVKLAPNSLGFTCNYNGDNWQTTKTYPRASGAGTTSGADYAYETSLPILAKTDTTITVNVNGGQGAITDTTEHKYVTGTANNALWTGGAYNHVLQSADAGALLVGVQTVGFTTETIGFTCKTDNDTSEHFYPRATDPIAGILTGISSVTDDTFTVHVYPAGAQGSEYVGFITQSPYVRNCTNFVPDSIGMKIDGNDSSNLKSMVCDSFTQYNQGGIGVSITNDGYAQLVSIFTICDDIAIYCGSGGQCDLTNSNSSFGNKGLVSQGIGTVHYQGTLRTETIEEDNTIVVENLGNERPYTGQVFYVGELFNNVINVNVTNPGTGYTSTLPPRVTIGPPEGENGITAEGVASVSGFGSITSIDLIASGTQYRGTPEVTIAAPNTGFATATATAEIGPIYYTINSATTPSAGISTITVDQKIPNVIGIGSTVPFAKQSLILASSHSFEYIGSGVTIGVALPQKGGVTISENQTLSIEGGKVVHTSTDERGNYLIGDDFTINQQTGTITGDAFNKSIQAILTPLIISLGQG